MEFYYSELMALMLVHFLAVLSPGPDFIIILRNSISAGRVAGMATGVGIGAGIAVHLTYILLGFEFILSHQASYLVIAKYIGCCYLIYLGVRLILSKPETYSEQYNICKASNEKNYFLFFKQGLLTNALNPKATLFLLAIFTSMIHVDTAMGVKVFYGVVLCLLTAVWFMALSIVISHETIRVKFMSIGHWFDRFMGSVLILFSLRMALMT